MNSYGNFFQSVSFRVIASEKKTEITVANKAESAVYLGVFCPEVSSLSSITWAYELAGEEWIHKANSNNLLRILDLCFSFCARLSVVRHLTSLYWYATFLNGKLTTTTVPHALNHDHLPSYLPYKALIILLTPLVSDLHLQHIILSTFIF